MKIALKVGQEGATTEKEQLAKQMERLIVGVRDGDPRSLEGLARAMMPLLMARVQKRATDTPTVNKLLDAARQGLREAANKYPKAGGTKFDIFALNFIETAMDKASGKGGGFFARLFGSK